MPLWAQIALAIVLGPALWLAGAIFFDFVHFVLHAMLRSSWRPLRALAWPHAVHHRWIDRDLEVQWAYQRRNVWCHIVPEYATQLLFTAVVAWWLPLPFALVVFALQTFVFVWILHWRGLDPNHRPIEMLDAYRPGPWTPPAYHALHHVHPDAYFSAYTKAVDFLVRGAAPLRGRRFLLVRAHGAFSRALAAELRRHGVSDLAAVDAPDAAALAATDVLVICDPEGDDAPLLEAFVEATRTRKLPPEAWRVCAAPTATARHYLNDVRLHYRILLVPERGEPAPREAGRTAHRVLSRIRRGSHFVTAGGPLEAFGARRRLHALPATRPQGAPTVRHRKELLAAA